MDALVNFEPMLLANLKSGDYVGFTFFIGSMAMAAATVFFFFQILLTLLLNVEDL